MNSESFANNNRPLVSISTDYGIQSEGVGIMKGTVLGICPWANVIDLTHGIAAFDVVDGARELETVAYLPIGIHICVVDPGVGTERRCLAIETKRGDFLIGPDNGVLVPAAKRLGGIVRVIRIEQNKYIDLKSSRTFAGRDVFATAAAWLARGISCQDLGKEILGQEINAAAFEEATFVEGRVNAKVIHVNKFGSAILNIAEGWLNELHITQGTELSVILPTGSIIKVFLGRSFAAVKEGEPVLVPDDYGRLELAINMGAFVDRFETRLHDHIIIYPTNKVVKT